MAAPSSIEIEVYSPTTCIVTLRREHDIASKLGVEQALALAATHRYTVVDLSRCTFMDAAVMGTLLRAASAARHAYGALELVVPPSAGNIRRLLELTGIPEILPSHRTRAEAIGSVEAAARLCAHKPQLHGLRRVTARIEHLQAKTEASRARRMAGISRVTVIRAHVETETSHRRLAGRSRPASRPCLVPRATVAVTLRPGGGVYRVTVPVNVSRTGESGLGRTRPRFSRLRRALRMLRYR